MRPGRPALVATGVVLLLAVTAWIAWPSGPDRGRARPPAPAPSSSEPAPTTSPATSPSPTSATPLVGGWYAGASGLGVADGGLQKWLGQPVTIAATWADQNEKAQRDLPPLTGEYRNWKGAMDIAVAGTVLGSDENLAAAANGAYDKRWRKAAATLARNRKDAVGPTFVRPFHEMNGDWYENWSVTEENSADFKKAFRRYAQILRKAMPTVYISWSPNYLDHTRLDISYWYPGDDVVDCVAPDYYDAGAGKSRIDVAAWNAAADDQDGRGNPIGPEAWRRFAEQHGKPVCFPEWGLKPEGSGTDHPEWIRAVNAWMNQHANTASWHLGEPVPASAAGKVLYSAYFNVIHQGDPKYTIHGAGANPRSAAVFAKLTWGNRKQL
jgi:Glycosyl hydrolase family 26